MTQQATIEAAPALAEPLDQVGSAAEERHAAEEVIADELLVEEVSIDGMCGVY